MKTRRWLSGLPAVAAAAQLYVLDRVWAGGEAATQLVVVADTRRVTWGVMKYFANLYNTDPLLFAVWAVALTAALGGFLGLVMDFFMTRIGIDLRSRKIVEH